MSAIAKTIRGINVVIGAETTGLQKALSDVNSKSREIQSELREVNKQLRFDPKNTELLTQKKELLSQAIANTREKLEKLKTVQEQVNEQFAKGDISERAYREFQREVAATEERLRHLQTELGKTRIDFEKVGKSVQDTGKKIGDIGKEMTMKVTAPIVGVGAAAVKSFTDVDDALTTIRAGTGATGEELEELKSVMESVSTKVPQDIKEVADVITTLHVGMEITGEVLDDLTKRTLDYARVNKEDAAESAKTLSRLMHTLEKDVSEMPEVMDKLTYAHQKTGIEVNKLSEYIIDAGPAFEEMGYNLDKQIALFSEFDKVGVNPRGLLSSLNMVMTRLAKEGFTDADEAFNELLRRVKEAPTLFEGINIAVEAFGAKFGAKLADDIRAGRFEVDELADALQFVGGTLDQTAEDTLGWTDELKMLRNDLSNNLALIGGPLVDALRDALDAAKPLFEAIKQGAQWFSNLDAGTQQTIISIVALVAAIGPLLVGFSKIIVSVGTLIGWLAKLKPIAAAVGAVIGGISAPVWLTIGAIAALIGIGVALWKNWDTIKEKASALGQWIKDKWNGILDFFKGINLKEIGSNIIQGLIDGIQAKFQALVDKMKEIGASIKDTVSNFLGIKSPSRVMMGIGENIGEGMAIGIERSSKLVEDMATKMAGMSVPSIPSGYGGSTQTNHYTIAPGAFTVSVKDLQEFRDITDLINSLTQTARQGVQYG